jgi:ATP-dependent Clp protease ATP-binding subunit ClpA
MHAYYDKVTDKARQALEAANDEAKKRKSILVSNLHILWGILDQGKNVGTSILANLKVDLKTLKSEVEKKLGEGKYSTHGSAVPYDTDAQECICAAIDYGHKVKHIGCQHLLLGLLANTENSAGRLLDQSGITLELVLAEIKSIIRPVFT